MLPLLPHLYALAVDDLSSPRDCGLALLDVSETYERRVVLDSAGPATLSMVGLVARMRRLLRSAYRLVDAGDVLEASILVRSLMEYLFTLRWLQLDPELHYVLWAAADLRARLTIDREVRELATDEHAVAMQIMEPDVRERVERSFSTFSEQIKEAERRTGGKKLRLPSHEQRAQAAGVPLGYSLAYRFDSLTGVHPMPHAIEQLMIARPDIGGIEVVGEPSPGHPYADPYAIAAHLLADALASAADQIPELDLGDRFGRIRARLNELAQEP